MCVWRGTPLGLGEIGGYFACDEVTGFGDSDCCHLGCMGNTSLGPYPTCLHQSPTVPEEGGHLWV